MKLRAGRYDVASGVHCVTGEAKVERDDYVWLTSEDGARCLTQLADDRTPLERLAARLRRELTSSRVHLVLEQCDLRRRARVKFAQAEQMFFTRQGLEQATDESLAAWKAQRFPAGACVADVCAGIGGDAIALARRGPVVAIERDPFVAWLLQANAQLLNSQQLSVLASDATAARESFVTANSTDLPVAWHCDPDRRAGGGRTTTLEHCQPNPDELARWRMWSSVGAVKLAPATRVPIEWSAESQREWVETRGECRQQLLWLGPLAQFPGRRSATVIDRLGSSRTVVEALEQLYPPVVEAPLRWIAEARPAVYAAGLAGTLAHELGASVLGAEHGYLTSDERRDDPAWQQFEVLEVLPFDRRRLKVVLRERGWRRVIWKSRGVEADLAKLSREMACEGEGEGVVLLAAGAQRNWAILARSATAADAPSASDS